MGVRWGLACGNPKKYLILTLFFFLTCWDVTAWARGLVTHTASLTIGPRFTPSNKHPRPKITLTLLFNLSRLLQTLVTFTIAPILHIHGLCYPMGFRCLCFYRIEAPIPVMPYSPAQEAQGMKSFILDFLNQPFQENLVYQWFA